MVEMNHRAVVHATPDLVIEIIKNKQVELNESLPNVVSCRIIDRERQGTGRERIVSELRGKASIPLILRAILSPRQLIWRSHQIWDLENCCCDYSTEANYFADSVDVRGRWVFRSCSDNRTEVCIKGTINIDARNVPGLPAQLVQPVSSLVERILAHMSRPNFNMVIRQVNAMVRNSEVKEKAASLN